MKRIHFLFLFCSCALMLNAQTRKQLEQKRKQKQKEIEQTKSYLKENSSKQKKSLYELQTLSRQIRVRQEIINTAAGEINLLSSEIDYLETNIEKLEENLDALKKQYGAMIYEAYKNRNMTDKVAFVLSGKDFNETYQHLNYLQQIGKYSKQKAAEIAATQKRLDDRIEELTGTRRTKETLVDASASEKKELEGDKKAEAKMLAQLKGKEAQMRKDLQAKEKQVRQLDQAIASAIAREIAEAKRKAEEEARKKAASGTAKPGETKTTDTKGSSFTNRSNTEAALALSADFEKNRNRLPWPVDRGYIIRPFGVHAHPTIPNVKTENNGVDIATSENAMAMAIFKGEVRAIFPVPGMGTAVLVSHGNYYSVYCKLKSVNVSVGSQVAVGTAIGTVMKTEDDERTELHLEIWKNTEKQNPEAWLR
jgi:septal ring factor EnvC (AmiA/AmiB activator)